MSSKLISRRHVKDFAQTMAKNRTHQFTRVGADFFINVEAHTKEPICNDICFPPSVAKVSQRIDL